MTCQDHDWLLPASMAEERDTAKRIQGRCRRCGYSECKPLIVWLNLLERMVAREYEKRREAVQ